MLDSQGWQRDTLPQLSQLFENDPEAKAFLLTGSLANPEIEVDGWSDMDVTVILADEAVAHYTQSLAWLHPFGRLIGAERHESQLAKTVRVCLEGFKRFDFIFVPESAVGDSLAQASGLFRRPCLMLWSRLPNLEAPFVSSPLSYQDISEPELERIINQFWFKAAVAIAKVVRNDLLIGFHLALDLARDYLLLQMIRRDREKQTHIHRIGGWGNEVVHGFACNMLENPPLEILNLIAHSCETFDGLASQILPNYVAREPLMRPIIEMARKI